MPKARTEHHPLLGVPTSDEDFVRCWLGAISPRWRSNPTLRFRCGPWRRLGTYTRWPTVLNEAFPPIPIFSVSPGRKRVGAEDSNVQLASHSHSTPLPMYHLAKALYLQATSKEGNVERILSPAPQSS